MHHQAASLSPEAASAIAATVIALIALGVSLWQGHLSKQHNRLSVTPHLRIDWYIEDGAPLRICLRNAGIGPATLREIAIRADGTTFTNAEPLCVENAMAALGIDALNERVYTPDPGEFMAVNEEYRLIEFVHPPPDPALADRAIAALRRAITVRYTSVYGEEQAPVVGPTW